MSNLNFEHSVYLEKDLCKGCINCIKRCPTQAIRVRNGIARITREFCIDCGECVRICPNHAKKVWHTSSGMEDIKKQFKYTVALPEPSFYAQFNHLDEIDIVLSALIYLGFDDVYEVSAAAELVSEYARKYVAEHPEGCPYIGASCPAIVRLIRVRFPNLIDQLLPLNAPMEVAADIARQRAVKKTGLKPEEIGIVLISPCSAMVTHTKQPLGKASSSIDLAVASKEIYPALLPHMKTAAKEPLNLETAGRFGVSQGCTGGESLSMLTHHYLSADGIENVIRVLEDLEDEKFRELKFIELHACSGGCVGGVLHVENPYVAKAKLSHLDKYLPNTGNHLCDLEETPEFEWSVPVEYEPVFRLGNSMSESIKIMKRIDQLTNAFPGLDCGSCGAPTCRALAEDIARGKAPANSCVKMLRANLNKLSERYLALAEEAVEGSSGNEECIEKLKKYVDNLCKEVARLDLNYAEIKKRDEPYDE